MITSVRIYRGLGIQDKSGRKVIAYASIQLENNYRITHIRVVESQEGNIFIYMPSVKSKDGYKDVVHALNDETRKEYREEILKRVRREEYSYYEDGC